MNAWTRNDAVLDEGHRSFARLGTLITALLVAVATVLFPLVQPPAASANPAQGFNAGEIISDANFYNGGAMSGAQVQTFLNQRVPRCTIGDAGRKPGTPIYGSQVATNCLRDARFTTSSRPANAFCKALSGAKNETTANYIARVGKACGISPKVLLVMLEKEQSLITDTWPTARQFDFAMGYDCPDSGPNNSANCSSSAGGFPSQVYRGAWQLKVYRAYPNNYNYRPFAWNTIQWHPNAGCGTSRVWISNWATAALYIYTPYRPNQAALNAGWGTGDACSSYGNRNFYNFYNQWFGSPTIGVDSHLQQLHSANSAAIGEPTANAQQVAGGVRQEFAKATMYWHSSTGASFVTGGIRTAYHANGGPQGSLGFPRGAQKGEGGGWNQAFQRGTIFWHSRYGGRILSGGIDSAYRQQQGMTKLGYPTGSMRVMSRGWIQDFERGSMTWAAGAGGVQVTGGIRTFYQAQRGSTTLGFARAPERYTAGAWWQRFDRGDIYWRGGAGGSVVTGGIRDGLAKFGGAAKQGYPLSAQKRQADGLWRQEFRNGVVMWSPQGGAAVLTGQMLTHYTKSGSRTLGFPSGAQSQAGTGIKQEFTKGTLYKSAATPFALTSGGVRNALNAAGGVKSVGFPLKAEHRMANGEWRQEYERALVLWSPQAGGGVVTNAIRQAYVSGSLASAGFPRGTAKTEGSGRAQEFTKATVYASTSGVVPVTGGIRTEFNRLGGVRALGFPVSAERRLKDGSWQQRFEKGTITWSADGVRVSRQGVPDSLRAGETPADIDAPRDADPAPEQDATAPADPPAEGEEAPERQGDDAEQREPTDEAPEEPATGPQQTPATDPEQEGTAEPGTAPAG